MSDYAFLPIKHPRLLEYYEKQRDVFWTPSEIKYAGDRADFERLDADTRSFITFILAFFSQADGIINENLIDRFQSDTRMYKEAGFFYTIQAAIETIHNETYSLLAQSMLGDGAELTRVLDGIHTFPEVGKIADWMFKWMKVDGGDVDDPTLLRNRVIAFACIEGIVFSSAFAAIYWIKKRNILQGLCKANEFIARDEAIHTKFAVALYHQLTTDKFAPLAPDSIKRIISSAVDLAEQFIRGALRVDLIGLTSDDMVAYIKCTANSLCFSLCGEKIYDVVNPFVWMAVIAIPNKSNFFETQVTEYARDSASFVFDRNVEF